MITFILLGEKAHRCIISMNVLAESVGVSTLILKEMFVSCNLTF